MSLLIISQHRKMLCFVLLCFGFFFFLHDWYWLMFSSSFVLSFSSSPTKLLLIHHSLPQTKPFCLFFFSVVVVLPSIYLILPMGVKTVLPITPMHPKCFYPSFSGIVCCRSENLCHNPSSPLFILILTGDEMGMLEDMAVGISDLEKVSIQITKGSEADYKPILSGTR